MKTKDKCRFVEVGNGVIDMKGIIKVLKLEYTSLLWNRIRLIFLLWNR